MILWIRYYHPFPLAQMKKAGMVLVWLLLRFIFDIFIFIPSNLSPESQILFSEL